MPPFGGPLPPTLSPAPPGAGPAVAPHGLPGRTGGGLADVQTALDALQRALPSIPMGTELHNAVLDAVKKISLHVQDIANSPATKVQNLLQMIQQARAAQPHQALAALGGGGGPPNLGPPGGPPPGPSPGMGGGGMPMGA